MQCARAHEPALGDGVDEAALGDVTVRDAGEGRRERRADRIDPYEAKQLHRHLDVAQLGCASHQARTLRGDERHPEDDVVTVVVVIESELRAFAFGNRERESLTGRLGALTATDRCRTGNGAKQAGLGSTGEFGRRGRHGRTHDAGRGYGRERWLGHATRLPRQADQTLVSQLSYWGRSPRTAWA